MIINDLDGYYIVFDTKNWNTELDTLKICILSSNEYCLNSIKEEKDLFLQDELDLIIEEVKEKQNCTNNR